MPVRQLPPTISDFTGRERHVRTMVELLAPEHEQPTTVVISAIAGMGGIGKTTLAIHVSHLVAAHFPDGQLHLNMRAYGPGKPVSTMEALHVLLRSLGMPSDQIPTDIKEAATRYRTMLAGRRVLVVLDNIANASQASLLLPGTAGCAVVLTSRRALTALPASHHIQLDVLSEAEALSMLGAIAGAARLTAEPAAARRAVRSCGYLPLAIRIAGARLATRPQWPVFHLADRLADEGRRPLDVLDSDDAGVRASLTVSLEQLLCSDDPLDNLAASAFDLLGVPDIPDISVTIAARLLDGPEADTEQILERLVDAHLLNTAEPGRYRMHDLLRSLARERASQSILTADRMAAVTRILETYTSAVWRARTFLGPLGGGRLSWAEESWMAGSPALSSRSEAIAWLDSEHPHIVQVARQAATMSHGLSELVVRLSLGLEAYYIIWNHWLEMAEMSTAAFGVVDAFGDRRASASVRRDLGVAQFGLGKYDEAIALYTDAIELYEAADQPDGQARTLCHLSHALEATGCLDDAVACAERGLALSRSLADPRREASAYLCLGSICGKRGDRARERTCHENALVIFEQIGDEWRLATALLQVGTAHREAGRHAEAIADLRRCVRLRRKLGMGKPEAGALEELGHTYLAAGDQSAAVATYEQALTLAKDCGDRRATASVRHHLGLALESAGRHQDARTEWQAALEIYQSIGHGQTTVVRNLLEQSQGDSF